MIHLLQEVAQAPTSFSWSQFFGTSGPLAGAALLLGYIAKIWIDNRKEKRADRKADLEGELGAVAVARDAVAFVREQMNEMRTQIAELQALREQDAKTIEKLEQRVRELEVENEWLKHQRGSSG